MCKCKKDNNTGTDNTGENNSGNCNSGDRNSGYRNSGYRNSGDYNSGYCNSGDYNSGNCNSGDYNSGNCNSGYRNSGDRNSGDRNSGDYNSGYCNSGDYNSGNCNSGFFNTNEPKARLFNKECPYTRTELYEKNLMPDFSDMTPCVWIESSMMTDEEKKDNPSHETTRGYVKTISYKEAWAVWRRKTSDANWKKVLALPNFDAAIFKEITGLDADDSEAKQKARELREKADELLAQAKSLEASL